MAEPAPATASAYVTITKAGGSYSVVPPSQNITYNEPVYFTCNPACWVWTFVGTTAVNAFQNESNYYLTPPAGPSPAYYVAAAHYGTTITLVPTDIGAPQPPPNVTESVRGTITVGSMIEKKKEERR